MSCAKASPFFLSNAATLDSCPSGDNIKRGSRHPIQVIQDNLAMMRHSVSGSVGVMYGRGLQHSMQQQRDALAMHCITPANPCGKASFALHTALLEDDDIDFSDFLATDEMEIKFANMNIHKEMAKKLGL
eukprot:TRINITY_DN3304_c0_g1_i1.p1 TRINITY_DN3304_c0_g1~~TRINITY_DN3304_c0_g1_i1.p1  ORF type:complete len:130 (-),score=35.19 TRINITY_DN3304_c0_g1_i1:32-421(-)